ncbi:MAG: HAMP domain-containing histidine kinase [Chitinophagaceae bacterium]|nr:HAMP domain-containing histidine kinase [Oligoflexus sp.]
MKLINNEIPSREDSQQSQVKVVEEWLDQFVAASSDRFAVIRTKVFVLCVFLGVILGAPGLLTSGTLGRVFFLGHVLSAVALFFLPQKPRTINIFMNAFSLFIVMECSALFIRQSDGQEFANVYIWTPAVIAFLATFMGGRRALPLCLGLVFELLTFGLVVRFQPHLDIKSLLDRHGLIVIATQMLLAQVFLSIFIITFECAKLRAENDLKIEYEKRLEVRRVAFVRELIGNVAHEINNPLAIIQASVLRLERSGFAQGSAEFLDLVDKINDAYGRICAVRDGLGLFAVGNKNDRLEATDVRSLFTRVLQQDLLYKHYPNLKFSDKSQGLSILCRAKQIGSALSALIENAMEAIHNHENGQIEVEAFLENENLCLSVTDNGRGIPDEMRDKIFMPFFSGHPHKGRKGLGLSVSRGTIAEHGGHLEYEVVNGQTRFIIRLPLSLSHHDLYYKERRFS